MPNPQLRRSRDRRESDLLLNVVMAHMAYSSAKDFTSRKAARDGFEEAVQLLYDVVMADEGWANDSPNVRFEPG